MSIKNTKSNTGIPTNPAIVLFSGDPAASVLNKAFINRIPGFNLGSFVSEFDISGSDYDVDFEDLFTADDEFSDDPNDQSGDDDGGDNNPSSKGLKAPTLSDIQLISNVVKYDSANKPYAEVVIRVMNSSGVTLKGIKAKVGKA